MNKKILAFLSLLAALILIISGCGTKNIDKSKVSAKPAQQAENTKNQDYKIGKDALKDKAVLNWQEQLADKKGIYLKNFDQYTGVFIGLGVKNTGGYAVKITEVKKLENKWVIRYEEVQPPKGSFVTQMINNVFEVVYIPKDNLAIEVYKIQDGKEIKETPIS